MVFESICLICSTCRLGVCSMEISNSNDERMNNTVSRFGGSNDRKSKSDCNLNQIRDWMCNAIEWNWNCENFVWNGECDRNHVDWNQNNEKRDESIIFFGIGTEWMMTKVNALELKSPDIGTKELYATEVLLLELISLLSHIRSHWVMLISQFFLVSHQIVYQCCRVSYIKANIVL